MNERRNTRRFTPSQARWLAAGIGCVVLPLGTWAVLDLIQHRSEPHTISGDSMAPALRGASLQWRCPECRLPFTTTLASTDLPVCPNCGRRNIPATNATVRKADQLALSADANPSRLDLMAYTGDDTRRMIKRVWGLPGEEVSIAAGDFWIDGRRFQKSLEQFRQVAHSVHDTAFASAQHSRWSSKQMTHHTDANGGRFFVGLRQGEVRYDHAVSFATIKPRTEPSPLYDHYPHNVGSSRQLHPVRDVVFDASVSGKRLRALRLRLLGNGVDVVCHGRLQGRQWQWDARGDAEGQSSTLIKDDTFQLTMGICDGRLLLAVDGRLVLARPINDKPIVAEPLRIVVSFTGDRCVVRRVQIWRDIHLYAHPRGNDLWRLGADQWLVLGDNQPESLDSRQIGPVSREDVIGVGRWRRPPPP